MMNLHFTINTTPIGQARPKHSTIRCKNGRTISTTYKSATQRANENTLEALLAPYVPETPIVGPVALHFVAYLPMPASTSQKRKEAMWRGEILPTKKPDIDNVAKFLCDAMTRLQFWKDDKQVCKIFCSKEFDTHGHWDVTIEELAAEGC